MEWFLYHNDLRHERVKSKDVKEANMFAVLFSAMCISTKF